MHHFGISTVLLLSLFDISRGSILRRDNIQSTAQCGNNSEWASNKEGLSPCLLLAAVSAPCYQGSFTTTPLTTGGHYDPPLKSKPGTVNQCTCSWAAYNLLSACTACQGQLSSVPTWPFYRTDCGDLISNTTYWPSDILIVASHTIPFYAGKDPNTWKDQQFNIPEAMQIVNQNHSDLTGHEAPPPSSPKPAPKKSKSIGAIVGGTVGGVFVLGIASLLLFCMCRPKRKPSGVQEFPPPRKTSYFSSSSGSSGDSASDTRTRMKSIASISSFGSVMSSQPQSPNTVYTYDGTMQSFSQFGSASMYTTNPQTSPSHLHDARVVSPAPTMQTTAPDQPEHISPFMLRGPDEYDASTLAHRRKEALGRGIPASQVHFVSNTTGTPSEVQTSPGEQMRQLREVVEEEDEPRALTRGRSQSQPPAYDTLLPTPSEVGSSFDHAALLRERQGHSHRGHGAPPEKGSQDSQTTQWTSIGGSSDSTVNPPTVNTSVPPPPREEDDAQTPRAEPARIQRYRSVQSSESRDAGDVEVA